MPPEVRSAVERIAMVARAAGEPVCVDVNEQSAKLVLTVVEDLCAVP